MNPYLSVRGLRKEFEAEKNQRVRVFDDISLDICRHEFLSIVGPSGCGKTTLLRIIGGLIEPTSGEILLDGRNVFGPPAEMVYLSQQYSRSLFPWRTVRQNVEFPLEHHRQVSRKDRVDRAQQALSQVGLSDVGDRYPWQLSGGMQQRVAIARALVARPTMLLLDEPFSSVDALTRLELEDLILDTRREHQLTILLVTHDIEEAVYLSDRVAVMTRRPGSIATTLTIDLSQPRDQLTTRSALRFVELRQHLYGLVRDDTLKSAE